MQNETETPPQTPNPFIAAQERIDRQQREFEAKVEAARLEMQEMIESCDAGDLETMLVQHSHIVNSLLRQTLDKNAGPAMNDTARTFILSANRECRSSIAALSHMRLAGLRAEALAAKLRAKSGKRTDSSDKLYDAEGRLIYDFSKDKDDGCTEMD